MQRWGNPVHVAAPDGSLPPPLPPAPPLSACALSVAHTGGEEASRNERTTWALGMLVLEAMKKAAPEGIVWRSD